MKNLTKAEEGIMHYFWDFGPLKVSEILSKHPEPKPAQTTVSTLVRMLEDKEFLRHEKEGRGYRYFPTVSKDIYKERSLGTIVKQYFDNSPTALVSHLVESENIDCAVLQALLDKIKSKS